MVYAISDIHGRFKEFKMMLKKIKFSENDTLYILGDVVDRGPEGIKCLQYIMQQSNMHMLIGNHEYMMYHTLINSPEGDSFTWFNNGGIITSEQFSKLPKKEQNEVLKFIKELPINIECTVEDKKYLLVHACPLPKYFVGFFDCNLYRYANNEEYAIWNRKIPKKIDRTIIFGHTPTMDYKQYDKARVVKLKDLNAINIDCGAAYPEYGGRLGCICLNTQKITYCDIKN